MVDGWIWKKGRLFLYKEECWLINLDCMVKLENQYFAIIITKIGFGKEWSVDAEYKLEVLKRNRMFCCSVTQSCPNPMDCNTPGFPVLHYLPELAQTYFHWVDDAIQPFHPPSSPSPPALNLSQHRSLSVSWLFVSVGQSIRASASASVLLVNIQGWFPLGLTGFDLCPGDSQESSPALQFKRINFSALSLLYGPTLTSIHDYWKNIALTIRTFIRKVMSLLFNALSKFVIAFLPRSKHFLISCLHSPIGVILEPKKIKSLSVSIFSPSICHGVMGPDAVILVFWMLSFKPDFSLLSHLHQKALMFLFAFCHKVMSLHSLNWLTTS